MKRFLFIFIAAGLTGNIANSQSVQLSPTVIASAGGYGEGTDINLSWTLGEIAVSTLQGNNMVLTQGFHQPINKIDDALLVDPIRWQVVAYPNPVDNELLVQFDLPEPEDFIIELQDVTGRITSQEQFKGVYQGDIVPIDMTGYKTGVYFLRITTKDREQVRVISIRKR
ncbi:MAG: T9SS type A sorting domain-containing protein [Bacteroidales bacterium]|nr:T9SS type A sorting domain-containing protein [Bacteroidales bacterium]